MGIVSRELKDLIKRSGRAVGLDIQRWIPDRDPAVLLGRSLRHFGVDFVIDIGANQGQFAVALREGGYAGKILSIEPLSSAHRALTQTAREDPDWDVAPRVAVGDREGEVELNISENSLSSSVLPILEAHVSAAPGSRYLAAERVPLARLDSLVLDHLEAFENPFLKVDAQGFEWEVLDGAPEVLARSTGVLCEASLVPLYEGQRLWRSVLSRLEESGFSVWSIQPVFANPEDGRTLQLDITCFRT